MSGLIPGFDGRMRAYLSKLAKPDDDITIMARARHWRIFGPDWGYIREFPSLDVSALCGLSVGLKPFFASPAWVANVAIPHFSGQAMDEFSAPRHDRRKAALLQEFLKRVMVAQGNIEPLGALTVTAVDGDAVYVPVADFAAMTTRLNWRIPKRFTLGAAPQAAPARDEPQGKPQNIIVKQSALNAHIEPIMKEPGKLAGLLSNAAKNGLNACRAPGGWDLGEVARWLLKRGYLKPEKADKYIESIILKVFDNS